MASSGSMTVPTESRQEAEQAPERALVVAAQRGDRAALERLLASIEPRLYRFGVRLCGHRPDAQDVLQESLIAVARALPGFSGQSSLSSWLYAIARSFCVKQRRRRAGQPASSEALDDVAGEVAARALPPDELVAQREVNDLVQAALGRLSLEQREVVVLRDLEGLSAEEAAQVLGIGVPALKSRLHRARAALREALASALGPVSAPAAGCPDVLALYSAKLEGDISADLCAEVEAHVRACDRCAAACTTLQEALQLCRTSPGPALPAEVSARVRGALRAALREVNPGST